MRLFLIMLVVTLSNGIAWAQDDRAFVNEPVFEPAIDYNKVPVIANCREEAVPVVKYFACRDSQAIYDKALANAKKSGQPLMVIFGFNKCPYCEVLERGIFNSENPVRGVNVARYYSRSELETFLKSKKSLKISVVRLHARSPHGLALADKLGVTKMANDRGWHRVWSPFVVMVNPETGKMASESKWEAKEVYCDWSVTVVANLENVDLVERGIPYAERKRCAKS